MSQSLTPTGLQRANALVKALEKLKRIVARRPRINDEDFSELGQTAENILKLHANHPQHTVADDLAILLSAVRTLRMPEAHDDDSDEGRERVEAIEAWNGSMRNAIDAALEAARALGVSPSVPDLPQDFSAVLPRASEAGKMTALVQRLKRIESALNELKERAGGPDSLIQLSGTLGRFLDPMRVEIDLAKLHLGGGSEFVDLSALARVAENMTDLTSGFVASIVAASDRIAVAVVETARSMRRSVRVFVAGVATKARVTLRAQRAAMAATIQEAPQVDSPIPQSDFMKLIANGDEMFRSGNPAAAADQYQKCAELARRRVTADGNDVQARRDLLTSISRVGDVYLQLSDWPGAMTEYRESLYIARELARPGYSDKQAQRELSASLENLGTAQRQGGDPVGALVSFSESSDIRRKLALVDPKNARAQRDLCSVFRMIGEVLDQRGDVEGALRTYSESLNIARKVARAEFGRALGQRELAVCLDRVGDVLLRRGDTEDALRSYAESRDIRRKLAQTQPDDAQALRDVSISFTKVGDALSKRGDINGALSSFADGLNIVRKLTLASPGDANAFAEFGSNLAKVAQSAEALGDRAAAHRYYTEAKGQFAAALKLAPDWQEAEQKMERAARDASRVR